MNEWMNEWISKYISKVIKLNKVDNKLLTWEHEGLVLKYFI